MNYKLNIYFKNNSSLKIILKDKEDLCTFELWYLNAFKSTLKIIDKYNVVYYVNKNEITYIKYVKA